MCKLYVGTYAKYNAGNLAGAWIDLAECKDYQDFIARCKELHSDEADPELMVQDTEGLPDGLQCGEWLTAQDFADIKEAESCKGLNCQIIDYSEKAIAVTGETKAIKDQLKALGGRFNPRLTCGAGWIFSKRKRDAVEALISGAELHSEAAARPADTMSPEARELLSRYLREAFPMEDDPENRVKGFGGAFVLPGGRVLVFDKDRIETHFCFGEDGGESLTRACNMAAKARNDENYFLAKNLSWYDETIRALENTDPESCECVAYTCPAYYRERGKQIVNVVPDYWYDVRDRQDYARVTDEERPIILAAVKTMRAKFEKRLHAYLKRYGLSKVHSWTYWTEA